MRVLGAPARAWRARSAAARRSVGLAARSSFGIESLPDDGWCLPVLYCNAVQYVTVIRRVGGQNHDIEVTTLANPPRPPAHDDLLAVWFALSVMFALLIGAVGGLLAWRSGQSPAGAILTGGYVFGGTLTLAILVIKLLRR